MIDLNNIVAKEGIGEGGNWKVYRCLLQDCSSLIVKESKGFVDMAIKGSIKKYQLIKALYIPTTSFLEVSSLDGKSVLVTEDLNSDNICFVSPNSVKTEKDELLACLRDNLTPCLSSERIDSKSEQYFYKNKIKEISNLPSFLQRVKEDINKAACNNISIVFDSYFFSIEKGKSCSVIDYKIADWDNIEECEDVDFKELLNANIVEFQEGMFKFLELFVQEGEKRELYQSLISGLTP